MYHPITARTFLVLYEKVCKKIITEEWAAKGRSNIPSQNGITFWDKTTIILPDGSEASFFATVFGIPFTSSNGYLIEKRKLAIQLDPEKEFNMYAMVIQLENIIKETI